MNKHLKILLAVALILSICIGSATGYAATISEAAEQLRKQADAYQNAELKSFRPSYTKKMNRDWLSSGKYRALLTLMLAVDIMTADYSDGNTICSDIVFGDVFVGKTSDNIFIISGCTSSDMFEIYFSPKETYSVYRVILPGLASSMVENSMRSSCTKVYTLSREDITWAFEQIN